MTDKEFKILLAEAAQLGREAGKNAASWWEQDAIGGRSSNAQECAELTLKMLDDGDPAIYDSLPSPNLSGEWADDPTPQSLMAELDCEDCEPEVESDLCDAWSDAASEAVVWEIERLCREFLA